MDGNHRPPLPIRNTHPTTKRSPPAKRAKAGKSGQKRANVGHRTPFRTVAALIFYASPLLWLPFGAGHDEPLPKTCVFRRFKRSNAPCGDAPAACLHLPGYPSTRNNVASRQRTTVHARSLPHPAPFVKKYLHN
jgi:hypothetical protein